MDHEGRTSDPQELAELASFCFRKLADIEARFIRLCQRAEAAGIDCSDLYGPIVAPGLAPADPSRRLN